MKEDYNNNKKTTRRKPKTTTQFEKVIKHNFS